MKKMLLLSLLVCVLLGAGAQDLKPIQLNRPDTKRGVPVMTAFEKRQSVREYSTKALSLQDLSDLLWAANGINRAESGKRTAPTAMNRQEITVYACFPERVYLYDAREHLLRPVTQGDYREAVAGPQAFAAQAPVCLVIVANLAAFKGEILMPAVDAGIVSQNISLFCAGNGLVTVPRATMDQTKLKTVLKLNDSQRPLMNHPVGYAK